MDVLWNILYYACAVTFRSGLLLLAIWLYKEVTMGIVRSKKRLDGKIALITGGNAGIGYETALELTRRGAEVIIASRNKTKGEKAASTIKDQVKGSKVHFMKLDLSSQKDIRRFAKDVERDFPVINILINNAGVLGDLGKKDDKARKETVDGHELIMATNYFGSFTLSELLLENVKNAGTEDEPSRIIHVSSMGNIDGVFDIDNLDLNSRKRSFDPSIQYGTSKRLQLHYNSDLAKRLSGTNCQSVALHPGAVRTDITQDTSPGVRNFLKAMFYLVGKSPAQGAQTSIYAAVSEDDLNGQYLSDCRPSYSILTHKTVGDADLEAKVYKATKHLLGLK